MSQERGKLGKLNVVPGKLIGPFVLGMPLSVTIDFLKKNFRDIKNIDLLYSETLPIKLGIVLRLNDNGIQLHFGPSSQCLDIVEIFDPLLVTLAYCGTLFTSTEILPTFPNIYQLFGPSYPGTYNDRQHDYKLSYPGISFYFPIPSQYETLYSKGKVPLQFPDGTASIVHRLTIYNKDTTPPLPSLSSSSLLEPSTPWSRADIVVKPSVGFYLLHTGGQVLFGDSCQDVLYELGPPSKIFYKDEDKMKIHARTSIANTKCNGYFYNYYPLGLDLLFSSTNHRVVKVVLHTNHPCHYDFQVYQRCHFKILVPSPTHSETKLEPDNGKQGECSEDLTNKIEENSGKYPETTRDLTPETFRREKWIREERKARFIITPDTTWPRALEILGPCLSPPVVFDPDSSTNPFGPTHFFGYKDTIFEVMRNDYLASVTLFCTD